MFYIVYKKCILLSVITTIEAFHTSRDNGVGIADNISVPVVGPMDIVDLHSHTDEVLDISRDKPEQKPDRAIYLPKWKRQK